jgi:hypothetical protein
MAVARRVDMITDTRRIRTLRPFALCVLLAACGEQASSAPSPPPPDAAAEAALAADTVHQPRPGRVVLPGDSIYYTLTDHEWYARGEPLLHENVAYQPTGLPIEAAAADMRHAGQYQGVDYYVTDAAPDPQRGPALYVPVYEGYWQVFRPDAARVVAP